MRSASRIGLWSGGILALLLLLLLLALFLIDEPLRRRMEENINRSLIGYKVDLPELDLNPLGFSVVLKNLTLIQEAHPDPPVGQIAYLKASVHWRALLRARLVADFELKKPILHINLIQLRQEAAEKVPVEERGWQEAVKSIYPLMVNLLVLEDGRFTYIDEDPERPLFLREVSLHVENIRNIPSPERRYPSPFYFSARVFQEGGVEIEGNADFLAEPHARLEADLKLTQVDLSYFKPVLSRQNLYVSEGVLSAQGRVEYAPEMKVFELARVRIQDIHVDYVHTDGKQPEASEKVQKARKVAEETSNEPDLRLAIGDLRLTGSVGFVNKTQDPPYRLFLQQAELRLNNFSNHLDQGSAEARLTGKFMGSGQTEVLARFRPEIEGPDFDLYARIVGTQVKSLNDLLMATGKFDASQGTFSIFTEMHVKNQHVSGYVKPFFKDLEIYDADQDEEKNLFQRLYEGLIDAIASLLENEASDQVATKANISGRIEDPEASTWQIIGNLIRNAFFDIILPGFEVNSPRE